MLLNSPPNIRNLNHDTNKSSHHLQKTYNLTLPTANNNHL